MNVESLIPPNETHLPDAFRSVVPSNGKDDIGKACWPFMEACNREVPTLAADRQALALRQKNILVDSTHEENKRVAERADAEEMSARFAELEQHERFYAVLGAMGWSRVDEIPSAKRAEVLKALESELEEAK